MPWSRSSKRGVGGSQQDDVVSHFPGRIQEALIRVSNEARGVGVDGRVKRGVVVKEMSRQVWQRDTHV